LALIRQPHDKNHGEFLFFASSCCTPALRWSTGKFVEWKWKKSAMLHCGRTNVKLTLLEMPVSIPVPCAKLVSADELLHDHFSSSFDAAPNGRTVDPSCRYAGGNVLVGVHLLMFERARFTLEASCCSECGKAENICLSQK
jgi:hypothetical protein